MDTIEKILANAKPFIAKTREHVVYYWEYWEVRWGLSTRDMDLVHYISDDRWEGHLTAFGYMRPLDSEEIEFVRNYLGL